MTKAHWVVRTSRGSVVYLSADAMKKGEVEGVIVRATDGRPTVESGSLSRGEPLHLKQWERATIDDTVIETRSFTVSVDTPVWTVNVTSRPIYGLVQPLLNNTHIHGHWQVDQRRLDIEVDGVFPQPGAHGILGQSYQDAAVRNGRLDEYGIEGVVSTANETIPGDGMLPPMTTSAQAEGAIEGVHSEYKLSNAFSTDFKYSRFDHTPAAHGAALTGSLSKRSASTSEWDGKGWLGAARRDAAKREL